MNAEEKYAYEVLAKRFGFSPAYIKAVLEDHFESPSDAGNEHMSQRQSSQAEQSTVSCAWTLDEIRQTFARFDQLRSQGAMSPLTQYVVLDRVRKGKRGDYYVASDEQLNNQLAIDSCSSIDSAGNLVVNGQITKYGWLASFNEK